MATSTKKVRESLSTGFYLGCTISEGLDQLLEQDAEALGLSRSYLTRAYMHHMLKNVGSAARKKVAENFKGRRTVKPQYEA